MALEVSGVQATRFSTAVATVRFRDGHKVVFVENGGGWGDPEAVEVIRLNTDDHTVAQYFSPHQYPVNLRPFGWQALAEGYTHAQVVAYMKTAFDHVAAASLQLVDAWRIVRLAGRDIDDLTKAHPTPGECPWGPVILCRAPAIPSVIIQIKRVIVTPSYPSKHQEF